MIFGWFKTKTAGGKTEQNWDRWQEKVTFVLFQDMKYSL